MQRYEFDININSITSSDAFTDATAEELAMALENLKKNVPESRINNGYWMNAITNNLEYGIDYDAEYEAALNSVTAEDIKTLLQAVLAQDNFIQIVLAPKE